MATTTKDQVRLDRNLRRKLRRAEMKAIGQEYKRKPLTEEQRQRRNEQSRKSHARRRRSIPPAVPASTQVEKRIDPPKQSTLNKYLVTTGCSCPISGDCERYAEWIRINLYSEGGVA